MREITSEEVEAYGDLGRHICDIPETEPVVVFGIRGRRTEGCGRDCEDCSRYSECFPGTSPQRQAMWNRLLRQLLEGGEK